MAPSPIWSGPRRRRSSRADRRAGPYPLPAWQPVLPAGRHRRLPARASAQPGACAGGGSPSWKPRRWAASATPSTCAGGWRARTGTSAGASSCARAWPGADRGRQPADGREHSSLHCDLDGRLREAPRRSRRRRGSATSGPAIIAHNARALRRACRAATGARGRGPHRPRLCCSPAARRPPLRGGVPDLPWRGALGCAGRRAEAVALVRQALAISRETGMGFMGPIAAGQLAA